MRIWIVATFVVLIAQLGAQASPFTVDGSTLYVSGGSVGVSTNAPAGLFTVGSGTMVITNSGAVGIGTNIPNDSLEIAAPIVSGLRLTGGGSNHGVDFYYTGGTTYPSYIQVHEQNSSGGWMRFGVNTGSSGSAEIMRLQANGNVGIGTASPHDSLEVAAPTVSGLRLTGGGSNHGIDFYYTGGTTYPSYIQVNEANSSNGWMRFGVNTGVSSSAEIMRLQANGNVGIGTANPSYTLDVSSYAHATSWNTSSDARLKENIKPLENVLEKLKKIRGVSFDWNARYKKMGRAAGGRQIGMIAQEVEKEFPELVTTWSAPDRPRLPGENPRDYKKKIAWTYDYRSMDYNRFTAVLLEAIKEQQKEIEDLKAEIKTLKK